MDQPASYELVTWNPQLKMPTQRPFNYLDCTQALEVAEDGDLAGVFTDVRYRTSPSEFCILTYNLFILRSIRTTPQIYTSPARKTSRHSTARN
jgi:hypothetical protein